MIHRPSRHRLALALRRYVSRCITNDALDAVEVDWRDRGAVAVKERAWHLYDDLCRHRAEGRNAISRELRREIARWVLFLRSDAEYLWPEYRFVRLAPGLGSLLTLGWWGRREARRWREFRAAGDFEVWPFISVAAEREARRRPAF